MQNVLDPANNPEEANRIIAEATADGPSEVEVPDPPAAPRPQSGHVELLAGVNTPDGTYTTARVRGLTGRDEELLARVPENDLAQQKTALLLCGVEALGDTKPTKDLIQDLLVGDRDYLMLKVRQATYGNEVEANAYCPNCDVLQAVTVDIDDVPVKKAEGPQNHAYIVDLPSGIKARVALATGHEETAVFQQALAGATAAEVNSELLGACVSDLNDGRIWLGADSARDLGLGDRKALLDFINNNQPGPQFGEVSRLCENCGVESKMSLDLGDLFRP